MDRIWKLKVSRDQESHLNRQEPGRGGGIGQNNAQLGGSNGYYSHVHTACPTPESPEKVVVPGTLRHGHGVLESQGC